jgi:hypothetical protein
LPVLVPEINPIRIANAQTTTAAIHAIRTATRPAELASNVRFTMTLEEVWSCPDGSVSREQIWVWGILAQRRRADIYPSKRLPRSVAEARRFLRSSAK